MDWKTIRDLGGSPVVLIIVDGFGYSEKDLGNAILHARTPTLDQMGSNFAFTLLGAAARAVGLPPGQQGNSEVGHLNIGAGRIVYQDIVRIDLAIEDGSFFKNEVLVKAIEAAKKRGSKLHLMGLVSNGGVHSHINHLKALLQLAKQRGLEKVYVHAFMDGRDTSPTAGAGYIHDLQSYMSSMGVGKIATIVGRYYAMDRDKRWDRTEKAYDLLVLGKGAETNDPVKELENRYRSGKETDEFLTPILVDKQGLIEDGDVAIFFNFRSDRARQLTRALAIKNVPFDLKKDLSNLLFVTMTQYDRTFELPVAFPPVKPNNTLSEVISQQLFRQFHTAETEKYAHVTFFFNGGKEEPVPGEERKLVPSPKVATYDLQPEMSTFEIADEVINAIEKEEFAFILCNIAAPDMVGHTGVFDATVIAVEATDKAIGKIRNACKAHGYQLLVTADHGNAEMLQTEKGKPHTAHTTNPVPLFTLLPRNTLLRPGILGNVAPTILQLMGLQIPLEMIEPLFVAKEAITSNPSNELDQILQAREAWVRFRNLN